MNKEYWEGVETSLKNQRKFFERGIDEIDQNLERIKVLREVENENTMVSG